MTPILRNLAWAIVDSCWRSFYFDWVGPRRVGDLETAVRELNKEYWLCKRATPNLRILTAAQRQYLESQHLDLLQASASLWAIAAKPSERARVRRAERRAGRPPSPGTSWLWPPNFPDKPD